MGLESLLGLEAFPWERSPLLTAPAAGRSRRLAQIRRCEVLVAVLQGWSILFWGRAFSSCVAGRRSTGEAFFLRLGDLVVQKSFSSSVQSSFSNVSFRRVVLSVCNQVKLHLGVKSSDHIPNLEPLD